MAGSVQNKGARSRTEAEIAALSAALESYKADNGDYPSNVDTNYPSPKNNTNLVVALMPTTTGIFRTTTAGKIYFEFKDKSLVNNLIYGYTDPFGNVYGYYYSNGTSTYNGTNNYDLWSTAGGSANSSTWIKNW